MKRILLQIVSVLLISLFVVGCNKTKSVEQEATVELTKEQKAMNSFVNTFAVLSGTMMYSMGGAFGHDGEDTNAKITEGLKEMCIALDSVFLNLETVKPELYKRMVENPAFLKGADIIPAGEIGIKPLSEKLNFDEIKSYIDKTMELGKAENAETDPFNVYIKASSEWVMQLSQELNQDPDFASLMKK